MLMSRTGESIFSVVKGILCVAEHAFSGDFGMENKPYRPCFAMSSQVLRNCHTTVAVR
jgi:hypothetical protein